MLIDFSVCISSVENLQSFCIIFQSTTCPYPAIFLSIAFAKHKYYRTYRLSPRRILHPEREPANVSTARGIKYTLVVLLADFDFGHMEPGIDTSRLARLRDRMEILRFPILAGSVILDSLNIESLAFDQISIATHFGIDTSVATWSLSAYSITFGSFLLISGSAGICPQLMRF